MAATGLTVRGESAHRARARAYTVIKYRPRTRLFSPLISHYFFPASEEKRKGNRELMGETRGIAELLRALSGVGGRGHGASSGANGRYHHIYK